MANYYELSLSFKNKKQYFKQHVLKITLVFVYLNELLTLRGATESRDLQYVRKAQ